MRSKSQVIGPAANWRVVGVFTLSIFLSASLLFSVQPMFAKLVLPLLGGSSNVWNTAMVFFHTMLLCGYIYAHLLSKYFSLKWQVVLHSLVIGAGLIFLPLSIAEGWTPPAQGAHSFWLLGLFAVSVGVPFFAISANAPLLQRWFSHTDAKDADDPYFLYATSNAGSLLSLFLYPVLFEPLLRLQEQTALWTQGYLLLLAIIVISGLVAVKRKRVDITPQAESKARSPLTMNKRALWIFLAFVPSSLMLGVTSHMANNIASAPFLWIIPLSLYLLTFIIAFAKKPLVRTSHIAPLFPWVIAVALLAGFVLKMMVLLSVVLSLICYFIIALLCHLRLAEERPESGHLTEYYICMSFGGMLGGVFNALIAPVLFNNVYEYIVALLLAHFAVPNGEIKMAKTRQILIKSLPFTVAGLATYKLLTVAGMDARIAASLGGGLFVYGLNKARGQTNLIVVDLVALAVICWIVPKFYTPAVFADRSFFGVVQVRTVPSEYGPAHLFRHGDTIHNYQLRDPALRKVPLAYYAPGNTFDQALSAVRTRKPKLKIAMVGLGAGAMACYEQPGDQWTYYEIDPAVVSIATNPDYFSYMQDCATEPKIEIGDARLTILNLPKESQDFIMIDAFSSDAIPTHLVTREALQAYRSRLKPDGLIFFHTSNRVMDVNSVVARLAEDAGLDAKFVSFTDFSDKNYSKFYTPSTAMMVGKTEDIDAVLGSNPNWKPFIPSPSVKVWSDDYSSIIGPLRSHALDEYAIVNNEP